MNFINTNEIEINLGLDREYTLVQISDSHVIIPRDDFAKGNETAWYRVKEDFANIFNEPFYECHKIPSKDCFDKVIDYAKEINPDLLLLTGDIIDYYDEENLNYVKNSLINSNLRYLYSCGNHEGIIDIIKEFDMIKFNVFKVISIDNSKKQVSKNVIDLLKQELNDDMPVILSMHIPLLSKYNMTDMQKYDEYFTMKYNENKEFFDLIESSDNIKAIFCGHVHGYGFSYVTKDIPQYCASSSLIGQVNVIKIK